MPSSTVASTERMHCMEVWGGNSHVDRALTTPGLQVWVHSRPHEAAKSGGDVYYVSSCASGRITRLLLADVSGHGEEVGRISADLRDLMRRNINLIDQSRFVGEMNRQFAHNSQHDEFATALVCTFFSPTGSLQFCNAGHPFPLLYQAEQGKWILANDVAHKESYDGITDTPLGAIDDAEYSRFAIKLAPGDMVMCVSDAFTESLDSCDQMLGLKGLLGIVQRLDSSRPEGLVNEFIEKIICQRNDNLKQDDATVLLFRADGSSPSLTSDFLAPIRFMRGVRDA